VAQGYLTEALKSYRESLAIRERLAKADPNNAGWQRDLSLSYEKVGDVLVAQGNLTEALKSHRESLAIRERLAKADPNNASWQRELAIINERLGAVYIKRNETDEAKAAFELALAIYDSVTARFPDDTRALIYSAVPLMRLGELYGPDGRAYLQKALTILKQLDEAGRLEPRRKPEIARIERELAKLQNAEAPPK
jgi:tetratricopeptide (TPR) repeat protein